MQRKPRPRAASIMSRPVILTVGLVGLFMSIAINLLILLGKHQFNNVAIGSTMGLVAFSLMLVVATFECRDQTASVLRMETIDNNVVNVTVLVEFALALLIARGGALTSLLSTQALTGREWLLGALPAVVLLVVWELGKLVARRADGSRSPSIAREGPDRAVGA
jgi:Ca2+-transporting ATPase